MTAPRILTCHFPAIGHVPSAYDRLARVFEASAAEHCAGWQRRIWTLPASHARSARGSEGDVANTHKLDAWARAVRDAHDDTPLLLIDIDTLITRPLDPVWDIPFDLAYTVRRPQVRYPLNAGVIFLRVSDRTRAALEHWAEINTTFLHDHTAHRPWFRRYGGINQAAFGCLLETGGVDGLTVAQLPCLEWNCEDSSWATFDPAVTRIVHVKSALRLAVLHQQAATSAIAPLVRLWRDAERRALSENPPASPRSGCPSPYSTPAVETPSVTNGA